MENEQDKGWGYKEVLDAIISTQSNSTHVIAIATA